MSNNNSRRASSPCLKENQVHVRIVPTIDNPSRCLIFKIVDRRLEPGRSIKMGRYSERNTDPNCMSFKSKVVSRGHCEVYVEQDGKLYIRDTKSSSGTFLNHVRLSPAGQGSEPVEIHHGDLVQLGVDFQGGKEEVYRSVKMRFELNPRYRPTFHLNTLQNLSSATKEECCICLYDLSPFQALFVSPCAHTFHFKCIRPLFSSYPGFQCPLCRTYSDLEESLEGTDLIQEDPVLDEPINRYTTAVENNTERERKTSHVFEKITVFLEKKKTSIVQIKRRHQSSSREIAFSEGEPSSLT
ncbi:hypothetical protein G6F56_002089 [Rhizopus delemar]|uniref:Uncharacterized protein n=1 Tax=Rhizopus stolonifer TaxID=4846 RepID=A0A367KJ28_RHIST|nr:hypothetical protein G6F56_002089 [Rhizopus delemar]RCI02206.1 hypothetical protein CU098_008552 [Rhizopus stolonifer]